MRKYEYCKISMCFIKRSILRFTCYHAVWQGDRSTLSFHKWGKQSAKKLNDFSVIDLSKHFSDVCTFVFSLFTDTRRRVNSECLNQGSCLLQLPYFRSIIPLCNSYPQILRLDSKIVSWPSHSTQQMHLPLLHKDE